MTPDTAWNKKREHEEVKKENQEVRRGGNVDWECGTDKAIFKVQTFQLFSKKLLNLNKKVVTLTVIIVDLGLD